MVQFPLTFHPSFLSNLNFTMLCLLLAPEFSSGSSFRTIRNAVRRNTVVSIKKCCSTFLAQRRCRPEQTLGSSTIHRNAWRNIQGGMAFTSEEDNPENDGDVSPKVEKSKSKKKKKKCSDVDQKKSSTSFTDRSEIQKAMKRTADVADILGQEIRNRRDVLLSDPISLYYDSSMSSLGYAIGMSVTSTDGGDSSRNQLMDDEKSALKNEQQNSRRAKLENYFFKSHNGLYLIQTLSSLLTSLLGVWCCTLVFRTTMTSNSQPGSSIATSGAVPFILMRRCILTAMAKHIAGFAAMILLSAAQIRTMGLFQTRMRMRLILTSPEEGPIAQYLFYCALLLVWTRPEKNSLIPWYFSHLPLVLCLLGPILVRELVHVAWVISDVIVILSFGQTGGSAVLVQSFHRVIATVFNAWMSLIVGAAIWNNSDSAARQRILSGLVSRVSFVMEVATGSLLLLDTMRKCADYTLLIPGSQRPLLIDVIKGIFCVRLYLNYLHLKMQKQS